MQKVQSYQEADSTVQEPKPRLFWPTPKCLLNQRPKRQLKMTTDENCIFSRLSCNVYYGYNQGQAITSSKMRFLRVILTIGLCAALSTSLAQEMFYTVNDNGVNDSLRQPCLVKYQFQFLKQTTPLLARPWIGSIWRGDLVWIDTDSGNFFSAVTGVSYAGMMSGHNWKQDIQLLGALNLPIGPGGSEYGGIGSTRPGLYVSTGPSLFMQLARYF